MTCLVEVVTLICRSVVRCSLALFIKVQNPVVEAYGAVMALHFGMKSLTEPVAQDSAALSLRQLSVLLLIKNAKHFLCGFSNLPSFGQTGSLYPADVLKRKAEPARSC